MKIIPVILLGGSGTRLWPVSRRNHPKQFLKLTGDQTLLQETLIRLDGIPNLDASIIICNEEHRFTTAEQLLELERNLGDIILEPIGKNTAPAVAVGALRALQKYDDALLLVLPADHVIKDKKAFHSAIEIASKLAVDNKLVTFGITPTKAETGYGYIKYTKEKDLDVSDNNHAFQISKFVEKPNLKTAKYYLDSGNYLWNSGMFLFKASVFLHELEKHNPEIIISCQKSLERSQHDLDFIRLDKDSFISCPSNSIDYALMEKTKNAVTVPLDAGWNDIGSWSALWEIEEKEKNNNVLRGDVLAHNTTNSLALAENKLIALVGVDNLVVIETKDAVLVASKDKVQDVKAIVEKLYKDNRSEATLHREVYRPWGKYDGLDEGDRFQVKRITVRPGEGTSFQMHHHRSEHWIVVSGTAEVTCNNETFLCVENQSAYIPQGSKHRIANPGKLPMEMIEVQTGCYLEEDDIVRFEDHYGRAD